MGRRAGIIGCGWIARRHVPAIDAAAGVDLVAACDVDLSLAEAVAGPRGARAYTRWQDMLDREQLDLVWVCTPPLHHREPVLAALAAGTHVYLEKPIARNLDDARAIAAAASAADGVVCAVGYQWHATELLDAARAALQGQRVAMLVGRNFGPVNGRPWFVDRAQGGGQLLERGSHHIDLQRAIAGEIAAVQAMAASVRLAQADGPRGNIDDAVALVFHFTSGALGCVHSAWSPDGQPEVYAVDILATEATIALELGPERFRISGRSGTGDLHGEYGDPLGRSIARFLEAASAGDRDGVFCTPVDALRTLEVAVACEQALETGAVVSV
ncbi:MAG TPA: Gfo/Idh/MocA family oxidoreductase [Gaiellales bacterium]|jgi:predicted dehydrogenase